MKVEQIAIFLENKSGRLAEITQILAENGINIRALSLADTADFGILRLLVNDIQKAEAVLKAHNFTVGRTQVCVVETPDKPGGLAKVLQVIKEAELNVEYMYAFAQRSGATGIIIFRFDDLDIAITALMKAGMRVLSGAEVYAI
ncbi:MAG: amino acid-binding protein [Deltaproteobacteria bacterium CG23_combo_of_CG06-09_8_20_14_all_60_8]|nr:MAG: amino acid-binding protein [Desulfobacterales bacterium CG2_30_60_27]PIP42840.1 MAG: amino acid-binding protein [Deltaproteobacteria bacterium CG23_combo_of_CG06-09_8_20_14_all_60_8]